MYHKIAWVIVTKLQNVNPELGKKESQEICAYSKLCFVDCNRNGI